MAPIIPSGLRAGHFVVDHLAYLSRRYERRKIHAAYLRAANNPSVVWEVEVLHEANNSCCNIEPWLITSQRIVDAVAQDGARGVLIIV